MKRLIPKSKLRNFKDNSDSLEARRKNKKNDGGRTDLELYTRAHNAWDSLSSLRARRERNINYVFIDQWCDWVRDEHGRLVKESERVAKRTGGVALQNNHLIKIIHSLSGLYAKQMTEPTCFARKPEADDKSDMMTNALQTSWYNNQMQDMFVSWIEEMLCGGLAIDLEEWSTVNGVEDVYSFSIEPSHFFFESAGIDPRHWDISLIGHFEDYTLGALAARMARSKYDYKQLEYIYEPYRRIRQGFGDTTQQTDKLKGPSWDIPEQGMCRVYHVWTKEHKMRYRCKDVMDFDNPLYRIEPEQLPLIEEENAARIAQVVAAGMAPEEAILIEYTPIYDTYWHYQALAPNGLVLEEYDNPYEHGDHPYVIKAFEYVNGDIIPFISSVIDQQRLINRMVTMFDLSIQAAAKGITLIPKSCVPKNMSEAEFARAAREIGNYIFYDDRDGRNLNKPQVIANNTNLTGITEMLQLQLSFIPEITSVSDALQGKTPSGNVAASRYAMETQNSTTSISSLLLKFGSFEQEVARKKMKMIHQFYSEPRNISIARSGGYAEYAMYDPKAVQDIDFEVRITLSPESPTLRMALHEFLANMWQTGAVDAATMLELSGLPGSSPIVKHLRQAQQAMAAQAQANQDMAQASSLTSAAPTPYDVQQEVNPAAMQEGHPYIRGEEVDPQTAQ